MSRIHSLTVLAKKHPVAIMTATSFMVIALIVAYIAAFSGKNETMTKTEAPASYKYGYLQNLCSAAVSKIDTEGQRLSKEVKEIQTQILPKLENAQSEITSSAGRDTAYDNYNLASDQYMKLYGAGGMTKSEYDAKMSQLKTILNEQLAQNTNLVSSSQSELNRLKDQTMAEISKKELAVKQLNEDAITLESCVNSVRLNAEFTAGDLAEIERISSEAKYY